MKAWIEEDNINYEYIIRYIRDTIPKCEGFLAELETYAKRNSVPISQPEAIRLTEILLKLKKPQKILEVGTAIGYSAIRMALSSEADITTIEISEETADIAEVNIKRAGLTERISVLRGDAKDVLKAMEDEFDFIFIDAAKGHYMDFFAECDRMLKKGGLLISDNVLYKGMTATDELVVRRKITIVRRLRAYLEMLKSNKNYSTAIVPIGDGVALSVKG